MSNPRFSIVTTVFGDASLIKDFFDQLEAPLEKIIGSNWTELVEVIIVHDGGGSDQWQAIQDQIRNKPFARAFDLSRNFGQHIALLCGYQQSAGDYVIRLNLDCQDPPSEIPVLFEEMQSSKLDMVIGLQDKRKGPLSERLTAGIFFKVFNFLTNSDVPRDTSSLRIMNRRFVEAICSMGDKDPFLQGLESLCGFRVGYKEIKHKDREAGSSSYSAVRRVKLAVDAAISYSDRPLRLAAGFGLFVSLIGLIAISLQCILYFCEVDFLPGYLSLVTLIVLFSGIQITLIAIVGVYVGKGLLHSQNRPLYFIRDKSEK